MASLPIITTPEYAPFIIKGEVRYELDVPTIDVKLWIDEDFNEAEAPSEVKQLVAIRRSISEIDGFWLYDFSFVETDLDDGPKPGNGTEADFLKVYASSFPAERYHAGILVTNTAPVFRAPYPEIVLVIGADGVSAIGATLHGSFVDPGLSDLHRITVSLPIGFPPILPFLLPIGSRNFTIDIPMTGAKPLGRFNTIGINIEDDDSGIDRFGISVVSVTTKSFINGMVEGIGSFPEGNNLDAADAANVRLAAFAAATIPAFQENPQTPARYSNSPLPTGESYRLYSQISFVAGVYNGQIVNTSLINTFLEGGTEFPFALNGTIDMTGFQLQLTNGELQARWMTYGHPDFYAEPVFNAVAERKSINIWHLNQITVTAGGQNGVDVVGLFRGSQYPSHRTWINESLTSNLSQGEFVNLWKGMSTAKALEIATLLAFPPVDFSTFVTEEDDEGLFLDQSTIYGPWNPNQ